MRAKSKAPDRLSFILYEDATSPRYYEIKRGLFQLFVYGLPAIALVGLLGALLSGAYLRRQAIVQEDLSREALSQKEALALKRENGELQSLIKDLQDRLGRPASVSARPFPLSLFPVHAQKAPPKQSPLAVESPRITLRDNKVLVKFNLVNQTAGQTRISGLIHLILKAEEGLFIWPKESARNPNLKIPFNTGEAFSTRRFRPVEAEFPQLPSDTSVRLWIVIHSSSGDILLEKAVDQKLMRER